MVSKVRVFRVIKLENRSVAMGYVIVRVRLDNSGVGVVRTDKVVGLRTTIKMV